MEVVVRLFLPVMLCLAACAPRSAVTRIETLEAQIAQLESEVARLHQTRQPNRGDRPPQVDATFQQAALDLAEDAVRLVNTGQMATLKQRCQAFGSEHEAVLATPEGQRAYRTAERYCLEAEVIGMEAPELDVETWLHGQAPSPDGNQLLVFWEVWCPHCKREVPLLQATQDRLRGKVDVVALTKMSRGATADRVLAFVQEHRLGFPVAKERDGSLSQAYNVRGVPAAALVRQGRVVWRGHPARLDDNMIRRLLDEG